MNTILYSGSKTLRGDTNDFPPLPQPAQVVMHLAVPYLDSGWRMLTDRYYTSVPLAQALSECKTIFTSTSNKNRAELQDKVHQLSSLKSGEVMAHRIPKLLALTWQAEKWKKPTFMVSTEASASLVTEQPQNSHSLPVQKPSVVDLYNRNMNGIDIADQHSVCG